MTLEALMEERLEAYRRAAVADLWLRSAGRPETEVVRWARPLTYEDLAASEWSADFETSMRCRMIMGALRYGRLGTPCRRRYDWAAAAKKRIDAYVATGNLANLVDGANLCLLEFVDGRHPLRHWPSPDEEEGVTQHVKESEG